MTGTGITLLPCPFCGEDVFVEPDWIKTEFGIINMFWRKGNWFIHCRKCEANGPSVQGINEAIYAWNKRVSLEGSAE